MNKIIPFIITTLLCHNVAAMGVSDDPLIAKLMVHQLEVRNADNNSHNVLEGEAWLGYDLQKIWAKFDIEGLGESNAVSTTSLWYSHAWDAYWDWQVGLKNQAFGSTSRSHVGIALQGLAPWWIDTRLELTMGENSQTLLEAKVEYEYMITQKWVAIAEARAKIYAKSDAAVEIGEGLSSSEIGLRVGYEFVRNFAPYIGINFENKFGKTADLVELAGEHSSETQIVAGLHFWF